MDLKLQRRLAAEVLKCGVHRVWLDPDNLEEIKKATTRSDIRNLIKHGLIKARKIKGNSRGRIGRNLCRKRREGAGDMVQEKERRQQECQRREHG